MEPLRSGSEAVWSRVRARVRQSVASCGWTSFTDSTNKDKVSVQVDELKIRTERADFIPFFVVNRNNVLMNVISKRLLNKKNG